MTRIFLGAIALALLVGGVYWFVYRPRASATKMPPAVIPSPVPSYVSEEQKLAEAAVASSAEVDPALARGMSTNMNPSMLASIQPSESSESSEGAHDVEPFVGGGPSFDSVAAYE